ncbi:unnamed protein product [Pedinophyceae sp. YPF-701]|nr:unnamed protein product [Pedinophyceae sp. YPF-701]
MGGGQLTQPLERGMGAAELAAAEEAMSGSLEFGELLSFLDCFWDDLDLGAVSRLYTAEEILHDTVHGVTAPGAFGEVAMALLHALQPRASVGKWATSLRNAVARLWRAHVDDETKQHPLETCERDEVALRAWFATSDPRDRLAILSCLCTTLLSRRCVTEVMPEDEDDGGEVPRTAARFAREAIARRRVEWTEVDGTCYAFVPLRALASFQIYSFSPATGESRCLARTEAAYDALLASTRAKPAVRRIAARRQQLLSIRNTEGFAPCRPWIVQRSPSHAGTEAAPTAQSGHKQPAHLDQTDEDDDWDWDRWPADVIVAESACGGFYATSPHRVGHAHLVPRGVALEAAQISGGRTWAALVDEYRAAYRQELWDHGDGAVTPAAGLCRLLRVLAGEAGGTPLLTKAFCKKDAVARYATLTTAFLVTRALAGEQRRAEEVAAEVAATKGRIAALEAELARLRA